MSCSFYKRKKISIKPNIAMIVELFQVKTLIEAKYIFEKNNFKINNIFCQNAKTTQTLLAYLCDLNRDNSVTYDIECIRLVNILLSHENINVNENFNNKGALVLCYNASSNINNKTAHIMIDMLLSHDKIDVDYTKNKSITPFQTIMTCANGTAERKILRLTKNVNCKILSWYPFGHKQVNLVEYFCQLILHKSPCLDIYKKIQRKIRLLIAYGCTVSDRMVKAYYIILKDWKQWLPKWSEKTHCYPKIV